MEWGSWQAFWAMGGYGGYVWGSFAVTAVLMAAEFVLLRRRHGAARAAIARARRNS
ncbi:MAG TPA: heme exporter protein CcmD [Burkholderiales bacterium]